MSIKVGQLQLASGRCFRRPSSQLYRRSRQCDRRRGRHADAFRSFLLRDPHWTAYLQRKAHMTGPVNYVMTDIMARFIAWEAYVDITK
jgi:hypothetical protein